MQPGTLVRKVQSKDMVPAYCSCTEWREWASVCYKDSRLGTVHLRLFKARQGSLSWWNLWEGKIVPSPHLLQELERSAKQESRLMNPAGYICTRKRQQDKCLKGQF